MTNETPDQNIEDTVQKIDAIITRNTEEIRRIQQTQTERASARRVINERLGIERGVAPLDEGLTKRLAYLQKEQARLSGKRSNLVQK